MFIQQMYTGCISEAAYYIDNNGEAAIIDPLRDIDAYLQLAQERNAKIKYIFETHLHADFVSGHLDLAAATGATIIFGPDTHTTYPVHLATDGESFPLGQLTIQALHTPGHTLESTCYLLHNELGNPQAIFTGDTLFVGDVGRPDLAQNTNGTTPVELATLLYNSLQHKILPLPDHVIVYPAHGAGSSCGKQIGSEAYSTIGNEKATNYALQQPSETAFVAAVTEGLPEPPKYFAINAQINQQGYNSMSAILHIALQALSLEDFKIRKQDENVVVLDTRPATEFTQGFVPASIFIGLEGRFAEWAGNILPFDKSILLVASIGKEKEAVTRLARVGLDKVIGYLEGGFETWQKGGEPIDLIIDIEADELAMDLPFDDNLVVVDVRKETEFAVGHVKDAINIPLTELTDVGNMADIDDHQNIYLHCGGGYRSVIATSLLKQQGFHNVRNILGGWTAIKELETKIPLATIK